MRRQRFRLAAIVLASVLAVFVTACCLYTLTSYEPLRHGMTQAETEKALGNPPNDGIATAIREGVISDETIYDVGKDWIGDRYSVGVEYRDGKLAWWTTYHNRAGWRGFILSPFGL